MRGKFLASKKTKIGSDRTKYLIRFEDDSYSVAYSPNDLLFRDGEEFIYDNGQWKTEEFGTFLVTTPLKPMTEEIARIEFEN